MAEGASRSAQVRELVVETTAEPALAAGRDASGPWVRQGAGTSADLFRRLPERSPVLLLTAEGPAGTAAR